MGERWYFSNVASLPLFDYVIVNAGRAGSMAAQNFLAAHPQLAVVPRNAVDDALLRRNGLTLSSLHEFFAPVITDCASSGRKTALVLRGYQPLWESESLIRDLASVVKRDGLILIVRSPEAYLISGTNAELFTHCGYDFAANGLPWWTGEASGRTLKIGQSGSLDALQMPEFPDDFDNTITNRDLGFTQLMDRYLHYFELYRRLTKHFAGEAVVLDSSCLESSAGLKRLFIALGVDQSLDTAIFGQRQNGRLQRYMHTNNVLASVLKQYSVLMRLWTSDDFSFNLDQSGPGLGTEFHEVCPVLPLPEQASVLAQFGGRPNLALGAHRWYDIPLAFRRYLFSSGVLRDAANLVFSQWLLNVQATEKRLSPFLIRNLRSTDLSALEKLWSEDTRFLVDLFPEELGAWTPS